MNAPHAVVADDSHFMRNVISDILVAAREAFEPVYKRQRIYRRD